MHNLKVLLFILILSITYSCSHKATNIGNNAVHLKLIQSTKEVSDLSDYIDDISVVKLNANNAIVPTASKMLLYSDKILLFYGEEIYEFYQDGRFSKTIGKVGRGPGEFIHLGDICIDNNEQFLIGISNHNELYRYKLSNGEFVGKSDLSIHGNTAMGIMPSNNNSVAVFYANPVLIDEKPFRMICFDESGKMIESKASFDDTDPYIPLSFKPTIFQTGDNCYTLSYKIGNCYSYCYHQGKIKSTTYIDFEEKAIPDNYFDDVKDPWDKVGEFFEDKRFKRPAALFTQKNYYVSAFGENSSVWNFITDGKKGIRWQSSSADPVPPVFFLAADKEYYYFLYLEYGHSETTDPLKRYVIDKTGLELKDNDNPAVIKVKFKI